MKFIWRYIFRKLRDHGTEHEADSPRIAAVGKSLREVDDGDQGLNITVRQALGGKIVSFRHHDSKADRYYWKTYVVPEGMDFEHELGKMITLESMRL